MSFFLISCSYSQQETVYYYRDYICVKFWHEEFIVALNIDFLLFRWMLQEEM
jgi:hypothetical protein